MKNHKLLENDQVELTLGEVKKVTLDIEDLYDQDLRDIEAINREIDECQARIEDARLRKALRKERIDDYKELVQEKRAIRQAEKEAQEALALEESKPVDNLEESYGEL